MKGALALRRPVAGPATLDTSVSTVTNAAYTQLQAAAARLFAASAILIHNPGAQPLVLAIGGAGAEVDTGIVIPINVPTIIPIEIAKNSRLSLKSLGTTQSSGLVTCSFLQ